MHLEARLCDYGMGSRIPALPVKSSSDELSRDESPLASLNGGSPSTETRPLERGGGVVHKGGAGGVVHEGGGVVRVGGGEGEGGGDVFEVAGSSAIESPATVGGVQEFVLPLSSQAPPTNAGLDSVGSGAPAADDGAGPSKLLSPPRASVKEWLLEGESSSAEQSASPTSIQEKSDELRSAGTKLRSPLSPKPVVKRKCSSGSTSSGGGGASITADRAVQFDVEVLRARMDRLHVGSVDPCTLPNEQLGGVSGGDRDGGGGLSTLPAASPPLEGSSEGSEEKDGGGKAMFLTKIAPHSNSAAEDELRREIRWAGWGGRG